MPISHQHKLIFIHIPKNAGTSFVSFFNFSTTEHRTWHYYAKTFPSEWKSYTKAAIIRNPWDRVVSNYKYAKMEKSYWHSPKAKSTKFDIHPDHHRLLQASFEDCVSLLEQTNFSLHRQKRVLRHQGWEHQLPYIADRGKIVVDYLFRLETLDQEFMKVFGSRLNRCNESLPISDFRDFYSDRTKERVYRIYQNDIDFFTWSF